MVKLTTHDATKHLGAQGDCIAIEGERLQLMQDVLLVMLGDVLDICEQEGVDYVLGGGSCIGAMRHGGFIPWDDDIDIDMTRAGYEKFAPAFMAKFGDRYWLHDPDTTDGYGLCFPQIRLKGTTFRGRDDFSPAECGVPLDIFIIENTPDNALLRKLHGMGSMGLGLALSCRKFAQYADRFTELAKGDEGLAKATEAKIRIGRMLSFRSMDWWRRRWNNWNKACRNDRSKYVAVPTGRKHYFGELWERTLLFPARKVKFESLEACVPNDVDAWLTSLYGDYMAIPPEGDRETHVVYEFDLGDLRNLLGEPAINEHSAPAEH